MKTDTTINCTRKRNRYGVNCVVGKRNWKDMGVGTVIALVYDMTKNYNIRKVNRTTPTMRGVSLKPCYGSLVRHSVGSFLLSRLRLGGAYIGRGKHGMNYQKQLQDPRWKTVSTRIIQRDNFTCTECNERTNKPQVHHIRYIAGKMAWEYDPLLLRTVCPLCHKTLHTDGYVTDYAPEQPPCCSECGDDVTNDQGYGTSGRKFYCEKCVNLMDIMRGILI